MSICVCVGGMSYTCGQVHVASGLIVTSLMPHVYSFIGSPSLPYLLSNLHSNGFLDVTIICECLHTCTGYYPVCFAHLFIFTLASRNTCVIYVTL